MTYHPFTPHTTKAPKRERHLVALHGHQMIRVRLFAREFDMTLIAFVEQALNYAMDNMTQKNPRSKP